MKKFGTMGVDMLINAQSLLNHVIGMVRPHHGMPWEYATDYIAQMKVCRESVRPWMEGFTLEANITKSGICKCCSIACQM